MNELIQTARKYKTTMSAGTALTGQVVIPDRSRFLANRKTIIEPKFKPNLLGITILIPSVMIFVSKKLSNALRLVIQPILNVSMAV